jgi:hypothetical protein
MRPRKPEDEQGQRAREEDDRGRGDGRPGTTAAGNGKIEDELRVRKKT